MTGFIKIGGMIQRRNHSYECATGSGSGDVKALLSALASMGVVPRNNSAKTVHDPSYSGGTFLDGVYPAPYGIGVDLLTTLAPVGGSEISQDPLASTLNNYSIVPGVRYQNLTTHYTGFRGMEVTRGVQGKDTTVTVPHGLWLPMVHVRYEPTEWLQLRAAYTNTLVYSDFSTLSPGYMISTTGAIAYNNFAIKPATSENIDLVVALHSNASGLLALNGFRKRISGLVFLLDSFSERPEGVSGPSAGPGSTLSAQYLCR